MASVKGGIPTAGYAGKFGSAVFYERAGRLVMRERVAGRNPRTLLQVQNRRGFGGVAKLWPALSDEAADAWAAYGETVGTSGYLAFMSLTRKWLLVHPAGTAPSLPPDGPFFGDNVRLRIDDAAGAGDSGVVLRANQPNAPGVTTEILVQRLANRRRKTGNRDWRTEGFVTFEAGALEVALPLEAGAWAVAFRFVRLESGQATEMGVVGTTTLS